MIDPLERLDEFVLPVVDRMRLPVSSLVVETRPEMIDRIRRVIRWHRYWLSFEEEIVVSDRDPGIPGTRFVDCGKPGKNAEAWYSEMCYTLADMCSAPFVLVWQWDGFVLNPKLWMNEFLRWDYIGKPIRSSVYPWKDWIRLLRNTGWEGSFREDEDIVGNGGFSLRSSRFLRASAALKDGKIRGTEDFYLSVEKRRDMEAAGVRYSPPELALNFVKGDRNESVFSGAFGFHGKDDLEGAKCWLEKCWLK
jgi:hypothetical protein